MHNNSKLDAVEMNIEQAQEAIALLNALKRLENNKDFTLLISTGYFRDEASRAVLMLADPSMQTDESQKLLHNTINACGHFRQYLGNTFQLGSIAERSLAADELTRTELLAEE